MVSYWVVAASNSLMCSLLRVNRTEGRIGRENCSNHQQTNNKKRKVWKNKVTWDSSQNLEQTHLPDQMYFRFAPRKQLDGDEALLDDNMLEEADWGHQSATHSQHARYQTPRSHRDAAGSHKHPESYLGFTGIKSIWGALNNISFTTMPGACLSQATEGKKNPPHSDSRFS